MIRCNRRILRAGVLALSLGCLVTGAFSTRLCRESVGQDGKATLPAVNRQTNFALIGLGTTFSRVQAATWLDERRFILGRWDGTLSLFRVMRSEAEFGPVLLEALATPSKRGVEMVTSLDSGHFVSSNDEHSLVFWRATAEGFAPTVLPFEAKFGTAVSAVRTDQRHESMLLVGHEHGYVTIWALGGDEAPASLLAPRFVRAVSVRSADPVAWKWQSWHVRGLATCGPDRAISVSEDGDICVLKVSTGKVLSRRRYNTTAQRGLNDVAVLDDLVAVVNCSVGAEDQNLWVYWQTANSLEFIANCRLVLDQTRDQVFTFSVELFEFDGLPHFVASTEEGLIWLGTIKDHKITILNSTKVAAEGGVALALNPENKSVLAAGHKIQTFAVGSRPVTTETTQP